ncbi:MAG: hypothetical protein ABEH78_01575 [Haloferacaceae archaeon]
MRFWWLSTSMDGTPEPPLGGDEAPLEESSILGDPRQRRTLSILLDRSEPITVHELGVRIAAREADVAPSDATEADSQSIRKDLYHRCLPKLQAVGWIERRSGGIIADEPLHLENGTLSLPDLREPEHPAWEAISVLLARPYRQDLASIIAERCPRIALEELTTELLTRGRVRWTRSEDALSSRLHHVDLPKLAEVGVVEYDAGDNVVACTSRLTSLVD